MFRILVFILIFLVLLCFVLFAQEKSIKFSSSVDRNELSTDDVLTLKITLEGAMNVTPQMELPQLENNFDVIATRRSQRISSSGGQSTTVSITSIALSPKRAGEVTIGEVKLKIGGEVYNTKPIKIIVKQGSVEKQGIPQDDQGDDGLEEPPGVTL